MRGFLTDKPPLVLHDWLHKRIGIPWSKDFRALARVIDNEIVGCIGYEGFNGRSCRLHMAGNAPGWLTREYIHVALSYPFVILDLPMVFTVIPSGNKTSLAINLKLGFKELLYVDGAHADGGLYFLQLLRDEWVRGKYGPEST